MRRKQISETANPPIPTSAITDILSIPFIEVLEHQLKNAVKDCVAESGLPVTLAAVSAEAKKEDPEGQTADEAHESLNENGLSNTKGESPQGNKQRHHPIRSMPT